MNAFGQQNIWCNFLKHLWPGLFWSSHLPTELSVNSKGINIFLSIYPNEACFCCHLKLRFTTAHIHACARAEAVIIITGLETTKNKSYGVCRETVKEAMECRQVKACYALLGKWMPSCNSRTRYSRKWQAPSVWWECIVLKTNKQMNTKL